MKSLRGFLYAGAAVILACAIGGAVFWLRPVEVMHRIQYARMALKGYQSRSVTVAGHRMHYDALGPETGEPVVLVHGLGASAEDWVELAPWLGNAGYRVYMPDLFGYGRSDKPAGFSYSVPDEADAVVGFLDAMGLQQVNLGGWSMGGWVVQWIAIRHPERIHRLMLFDSAGLYVAPDWNTNLFMPSTAAELNQLYALLIPNPQPIPGFVTADLLRGSRRNAWIIRRALDSMLTGGYATDKLLPQLKMPVLIVWGALDRITPPSEGEAMHRLIPQSQLQTFPGCGHLAPSGCAHQIGPVVLDFLKK